MNTTPCIILPTFGLLSLVWYWLINWLINHIYFSCHSIYHPDSLQLSDLLQYEEFKRQITLKKGNDSYKWSCRSHQSCAGQWQGWRTESKNAQKTRLKIQCSPEPGSQQGSEPVHDPYLHLSHLPDPPHPQVCGQPVWGHRLPGPAGLREEEQAAWVHQAMETCSFLYQWTLPGKYNTKLFIAFISCMSSEILTN